MSVLADMLVWSVACSVGMGVSTAIYGHYKVKACKAMGAPTMEPTYDNAKKAAEQIGHIVFQRMRVLGTPGWASEGKYGLISMFGMGKKYELINCLRLMHYVGLRLYIGPIADGDIEEDKEETEKWLTEVNEKWYYNA